MYFIRIYVQKENNTSESQKRQQKEQKNWLPKNVNSLRNEELLKINGEIIYPREMPENFSPGSTVCVRYVTETEVGHRVRLTEEYLKEPEPG